MSRKRISWLIGLLSAAMMGLVAFQFYWIREVNQVNEERFTGNVQAALAEVTNQLARLNDISFLRRDFGNQLPLGYKPRRPAQDSIPTIRKKLVNPALAQDFVDANVLWFEIDEQTGSVTMSFDFQEFMAPGFGFPANQGMSPNDREVFPEEQMRRRLNAMQESWKHHLFGSNDLFERIDPAQLDTLIHQELANRGINLPCLYGITHGSSGEVMLRNTEKEEELDKIKNSNLSVNLFPMDLMQKDYDLSIVFPRQKNYLFKQALLPLTSSGLLILVIIGCFGYAIMVILRQKKLSEIKNDFINNMTHEFKTPIATVSLATEALQDDDLKQNTTLVDRYVQVIRDENRRLGMQVEKVLQIATLDKQDFKLKFENTNVHDIIQKALGNIQIMVDNRQGHISSQLLAGSPVLEADKVHLTNLVYNLLDNANKYSAEAPQIHIRTENISTGVILKISDRGIGMSKEATEKIFDKFYRVSTGNVHDVKGFGLGLAYVKSVIEMHQGTVSVKSEPGKGSTFKVYLPFKHV